MKGCYHLFAALMAAATIVNVTHAQVIGDVTIPSVASGAASNVEAMGFSPTEPETGPNGMRLFRTGGILLGYRSPGDFAILTFKRAHGELTPEQINTLMDSKKLQFPQKEVSMAVASIGESGNRYVRVGNGKSFRSVLSLLQRKRVNSKAGQILTTQLPANSFSGMVATIAKGAKTFEEDALFGVASTDGGARIYAVANIKTGDGLVLIESPTGSPHAYAVHDLNDIAGRVRGWFNGLTRVIYMIN